MCIRASFHEQSLFAKYLHAFVSDFQNKCHLQCFICLPILRNRYNPMKIVMKIVRRVTLAKTLAEIFGRENVPLVFVSRIMF